MMALAIADKFLPHLVCWTTLAQSTLSDSAAVYAPPGPALGSPPSLIVAVSTAPSCEYVDVSLHPATEQHTVNYCNYSQTSL